MILAALLAASLNAPQTDGGDALSLYLSAGFPWSGVALEKTLPSGFSLALETETALARRLESRLGLTRAWTLKRSWMVQTGFGVGWVVQSPSVPRQGVQLLARLGARYRSRYAPFVQFDYHYLFSLQERSIKGASGERTEWIQTPYVSILTQVGVRRAISSSVALDVRMIFGEIDGIFAIPGASLGTHWRFR